MGGRERLTSDVLPALNKTIMIWYCPDCGTGDPPLLHLPKSTIANVWGDISCARRITSHLPWFSCHLHSAQAVYSAVLLQAPSSTASLG